MKNIVQASLITTFRCNAECHMCNIWANPSKKEEELEPRYYEQLPDGMRINVTGGEAMLRDDIEDVFRILYPKASLLELSTNGFYTDKIVRIAEKFPNILIRVSLEGLPKLNDKLRGTKDGFDHALRTMLELKKTKCKNIGFSIVINDKNSDDLIHLYELCCYLGVELGNSVMHNSWYFHKHDNAIVDREKMVRMESEFIKAQLESKRQGLKAKLKDYGRAFFNKSILRRFQGTSTNYRPPCGAQEDFFFIDPWGNVLPCNGSDERWIIGNIKEDSFQNIMASHRAKEMLKRVKACPKDCCFIVTERHDMVRRPWIPIYWVLNNKARLMLNRPTQF